MRTATADVPGPLTAGRGRVAEPVGRTAEARNPRDGSRGEDVTLGTGRGSRGGDVTLDTGRGSGRDDVALDSGGVTRRSIQGAGAEAMT